ncbi:MAG: hypothetical protein LBH43_17725 [Treponema sp.]|jgi:ribonucleoside-triphosphate reductase|nr:hypothetical protein [Treponema sp.]
MKNLEAIDREILAAREALSNVKGTPTEVYSRIVGYYRSVRIWNRGKREEYDERKLYRIDKGVLTAELPAGNSANDHAAASPSFFPEANVQETLASETNVSERLLLFIRASCPACPSAKAAAEKLGIPVMMINADTSQGMEEAIRYNVLATPTALLFDREGREINRARDSQSIAAMSVSLNLCNA